ncbi:MAG: hypothetical protein LBH74_06150 [Nitrososphaerota archaeon]|jgi:hypothetical protein|nr:hypothetical protein [Nitrososphaerota archaeon]
MNKIIPFLLLFFLMSGIFVTTLNPVSASELVTNSWNIKESMSAPRRGLGVIAVDGKIYAIGGDEFGTNERYDPKTDTWTTLTPMPTPRENFAIATYQNKIYCISSVLEWPTPILRDSRAQVIGVNEVYDTVTGHWDTKTPPPIGVDTLWYRPTGENNLQAQVVNGKIFVIAGLALYLYDPVTDIWTEKPSIPVDITPPYYRVLTVTDEKLIVIWEFTVHLEMFKSTTECKVLVYDPKTDL